ncbi:hypothetical protein MKZ21_00135 [Paenibacillus sp. FSL P2-0536]
MENLFGKLLGFDGSASPMGVVCTNKKVQQFASHTTALQHLQQETFFMYG